MKKKYTALLCLILVVWVGAFGFYGSKRYADAVKQMMSIITFKPGVSNVLSAGKPEQNITEKARDKSAEKNDKKTTDKSAEKTDKKTTDKSAEKTDKKTADKSAEKNDKKTTDKSAKKTETKTTDKSATAKKTETKTADKTTKKTSTKTADKSTKKTAKKTTDKTAKNTETKTETEPVTLSPEQIKQKSAVLKEFNSVIGNLQKRKKPFRVTEVRDVTLTVKKCSVNGLLPAVQNIVQGYAVETESVYNFKDGVATDSVGNSLSVSDVIPPKYSVFAAAEYNVSSAKKRAVKKGTELSFNVGHETVYLDGIPFNHASTVGYIDFSKLDLSPLTVTYLKALYKYADYKIIVDKKGNLLSVNTRIPFTLAIKGDMGTDIELKITGTIKYNLKFDY